MPLIAGLQAVLFDLDGTLVDAVPDLGDAARAMLAELGEPTRSDAEIGRFIGKGLSVLVERTLSVDRAPVSAERVTQALAVFERHYTVCNGRRSRAYPHAAETLATLRAGGLKLACVTNKSDAFTRPLLAQLGLLAYFDCVVSGDTLAQRKPAPEPLWHACSALGVAHDAAVMVGDSANDAEAAVAAGVPLVLVTYGYSEGEPVDTRQAAALVSGLAELPALLCQGD